MTQYPVGVILGLCLSPGFDFNPNGLIPMTSILKKISPIEKTPPAPVLDDDDDGNEDNDDDDAYDDDSDNDYNDGEEEEEERPCSVWKDLELSLERYHSVPGLEGNLIQKVSE